MMSRVTRSTAVWLLSTLSFGLDSTRVLPNESSSFTVLLIEPPTAACGLLYCTEKNGALARFPPVRFWRTL